LSDGKALCLVEAAKIIQDDILSSEGGKVIFDGNFLKGCE